MFKELENTDSHILWLYSRHIGKPEHGGDNPDTYFLVKLEYVDYWLPEDEAKELGFRYWMSIYACGPDWPDIDVLKSYLDTLGMELSEFDSLSLEGKLSILVETELAARLWHESGNNQRELLKAAKKELQVMQVMFGFYMDRLQNAIGSTGWDWIKGDILGGLNRHKENTNA